MAGSRAIVHTLKIGLNGARPPIWRRLEVPSAIRLDRLSVLVQASFEWASYHLWVFETDRGEYGEPDPELGHRRAASVTLRSVAPTVGARLCYVYDFGDDWRHDIVVESISPAAPGVAYPRCTAGRRASPPEDCGGVWGYAELLEVLADSDHPEHGERLEWLALDSATDLDPAAFDVAEVNRALLGAGPA